MKNDTRQIRQIRIGKHDFGIMGLTDAIEKVAAEYKSVPDDMVADALYEVLKKDNYISDNVRDAYKQAFLREYQKHLGLPVTGDEKVEDELCVTVVGAGCSRCENLEMEIMMVLSELDLPARVDNIRDPEEIRKLGILGLPAVLINDEIKCVGVVPPKSVIVEWLTPYRN